MGKARLVKPAGRIVYTVCQKRSKIVFVRTTSYLRQIS